MIFTATGSGTHYVSAGAVRDATGTYTLSVTNLSADDAQTAGTDTTGTVAVDGSVTGAIDYPGDRDWFAVTLVAGTTYRIDLEGSQSGVGTLGNPYLRGIYDSNGNQIPGTTNDNGGAGLNSRVTFTATDAGTYYVSAGAAGGGTGTYRLSARNVSADDAQTAGTDTTGTVAVDGSVTGVIDYDGDRDWFAVTLEAGATYRIDLEGSQSGAGTLGNPYLRGIYDSNGNQIPGTTDDDGGAGANSRVIFTTTQDGKYYVSAGAHWKRNGRLQAVGDGCLRRRRADGRDRYDRDGRCGWFGHGRDRIPGRPGLVCGHPGWPARPTASIWKDRRPCGTRICAGFTIRTATRSAARRMTTAARAITAG